MAVTMQDFTRVAKAASEREKAATDKQKSYIDRFFSTVLPKNPKAITKADNLSPKVFKPALMQEKPKVAYTPEQKKSALRDFGGNVLKGDDFHVIRQKFPEFAEIPDPVLRDMGGNVLKGDDIDTIIAKYPELGINSLPQGAVKGALPKTQQTTRQDKERNDQLIPRIQNFDDKSVAEGDSAGAVLGGFAKNILKSGFNVASDIGNAIVNPIDTATGIGKTILGGLVNLGNVSLRALGEKGDIAGAAQDTMIGDLVKNSELTADQVGNMLKERYGSREAIQKTAYEDPVGLFSDAVSIIGAGGAALKGASNIAKSANIPAITKAATAVDDVAGAMTRVAAADPYAIGQNATFKGLGAAKDATVGAVAKVSKKAKDALDTVVSGFSEADKKGIQNNPYQAEYWDQAMQIVDATGTPPSRQELIRAPLQELGKEVMEKLDTVSNSLSYAGEGYNKIKQLNNEIDVTPAHAKVGDILHKYNIVVKSDGKLDFTSSPFIQSADTSAIQAIYDRVMTTPKTNVGGILNLRKAADSASKRDGRPTASTPVVKAIRAAVDDVAKEQVPQLKELDELYAQQVKELQQLKEGLVYRDGDRKGQLRDNYQSIIKTLGGPNRDRMRQRLLQIMPDIELRVDAINNLPRLVKNYANTNGALKVLHTVAGVGFGGLAGGIEGMILGGIGGYLGEKLIHTLRKSAVEKIFSEVSPEAQQKLVEINAKIEAKKTLMQDEIQLIEQIKAKLQNEIDAQKSTASKGYTKQDLIDAATKRAESKKKSYTKKDLEAAASKAMETKKSPTKQDMIDILKKKSGK